MKKVAEKVPPTFMARVMYDCKCCGCCDCVEDCRGGELVEEVPGFSSKAEAIASAHKIYCAVDRDADELHYEVIRIGPRGGFTVVWTAGYGDDGELSFSFE